MVVELLLSPTFHFVVYRYNESWCVLCITYKGNLVSSMMVMKYPRSRPRSRPCPRPCPRPMHALHVFFGVIMSQTCLAVEECNSLDFASSGDMWFAAPDNIFSCGPEGEADYLMDAADSTGEASFGGGDESHPSPVAFLGTFMKVWYALLLLYRIAYKLGNVCDTCIVTRARCGTSTGTEK